MEHTLAAAHDGRHALEATLEQLEARQQCELRKLVREHQLRGALEQQGAQVGEHPDGRRQATQLQLQAQVLEAAELREERERRVLHASAARVVLRAGGVVSGRCPLGTKHATVPLRGALVQKAAQEDVTRTRLSMASSTSCVHLPIARKSSASSALLQRSS